MIITDKEILKRAIQEKIDRYVREFPIYFFGNIFFLLFFVSILIFLGVMISIYVAGGMFGAIYFLFIGILVISYPLKMFFAGFIKTVKILHNIRKGEYVFGVETHEMDNAIEFIEDLPMSVEDVDRLKKSLSFGKIIEVLEVTRIITAHKGVYSLDIHFKYKFDKYIVEDFEK